MGMDQSPRIGIGKKLAQVIPIEGLGLQHPYAGPGARARPIFFNRF